MSSPGTAFNPLAIAAPDLYARQIGISRRQALGQALLGEGGGDPGRAAYGGLRNAGNALLGAYMLRGADKDMASLYAPAPDASGGQPTGQISNSATMTPAQRQGRLLTGAPDAEGNPVDSYQSPMTTGATDAGGNQVQAQVLPPQPDMQQSAYAQQGSGHPRSIPEALAQMIVPVPGLSKQASVQFYMANPKGYYEALAAANVPTPEMRDYASAYPNDPGAARQGLQGLLTKNRTNVYRPGGFGYDSGTRQGFGVPDSKGMVPVMGPNGQMGMQLAPGAPQALSGSTYYAGVGNKAVTPATGYDPNNMPVISNQAEMSGQGPAASALIPGYQPPNGQAQPQQPGPGNVPNIDRNNPLNVSPGGQVAQYQTPTAGVGAAWENLTAYGNRGINTVQGIVSTWAPYQDQSGRVINPQTPENIARISQQMGVRPDQPLQMRDPNVKGKLIDLMRPTETGQRYAPQQGGQGGQQPQPPLRPELPAGQADFMKGGASTAVNMREQNTMAAEEVPTRINVLDNITQLINSGAPVGSTEWQNEARQVVAALSQSAGHPIQADNPAALMGEIQKYMGQYQLRMAKIQGGTGTDKQLEAVQHANPNDQMFPVTLKRVVGWLKANEQGAFAKANAQESFLAQNGQTPQNQLKFEQVWRNSYDPRVFQLQNLQPQDQAAFVKGLSPADARMLLQKRQALKGMGVIQ